MKIKAATPLLFFFFLSTLNAQPLVSKIYHQHKNAGGKWVSHAQYCNEYNDSNLKLSTVYGKFDTLTNGWNFISRTLWEYDESGRVAKTDFQKKDSTNAWMDWSEAFFEYDQNGCISKEKFWNYSNSFLLNDTKKTGNYGNNCQPDTLRFYNCNFTSTNENCQLGHFLSHVYLDDGKTVHINYGWQLQSGEWQIVEKAQVKHFDDEGRLLESVDSLSDIGPERWLFTWYENGKPKTFENYLLNGLGWYLVQWDSFEYDYNEQGLVSKKTEHYAFDALSSIIYSYSTDYDYYCDGLLHSEYQETQRALYEYTEGANCSETGEELEMTISPNPTTGIIRINAPSFQSGEIVASLYDAMGRLAIRKQVEYRTESVELDVSDLPNGIYMVNLNGIGKMKTEKLLIEK